MQLTPTQARVLGALAEKQLTTPQQYPLTLNALLAACNQTSNRQPVMELAESQVRDAVAALREKGLLRVVHPSHGSRVEKYRQVAEEHFGLDQGQLALLTVLLLRGPQTGGELRTRTERMSGFESVDAVEDQLRRLASRDEPLVAQQERRPGQKEPRWRHLLTPEAQEEPGDTARPVISTRTEPPRRPVPGRRRVDVPRLPPLDDQDLEDQQRELLAGVQAGGGATNIFATLVRHPGLFRRWLPFGGKLLAGKLPARDRELLILRTAWRCRAAYEWGHHVEIGRRSGLSEDEIARVPDGPDADGWTAHEALLLRAADELHTGAGLDDATWEALAAAYTEAQLIEVLMVVGHYHLVSFVLNGLGIQPEPGTPAFPGRMEA